MAAVAHSILLATNNIHKVEEFREIFPQFGMGHVELLTPASLGIALDPEETAETYLGNARIKAQAFHRWNQRAGRADLWVLADDSGLEVDVLDGEPGPRTARYHQSAPNRDGCARLLQALADIPEERRTARFRAVLVLILPDGGEHVFEGVCEGSIGFERRGASGFGFDPVFRVAGEAHHLAELPAAERHRISNRGRASQQAIAFLRSLRA